MRLLVIVIALILPHSHTNHFAAAHFEEFLLIFLHTRLHPESHVGNLPLVLAIQYTVSHN